MKNAELLYFCDAQDNMMEDIKKMAKNDKRR
jgi:hypothetical protein